MTAVATKHQQPVRSTIPARLDRPARYRGRTDIWINGSYWLGSILGTLAAFLLLDSLPVNAGWRVGFLVGPVLAVVILLKKEYGYLTLLRLIWHTYPKRAVMGGTLMITQSFLYNAIFFTYALVLSKFYQPLEQVARPLTEVGSGGDMS